MCRSGKVFRRCAEPECDEGVRCMYEMFCKTHSIVLFEEDDDA